MKNLKCLTLAGVMLMVLLLTVTGFTQDEEESTVEGNVSVTARSVTGDRQSAKFQEYREVPRGVSGAVKLQYRNKDSYFFDLDAKNISQDDQNLDLTAGKYGKYKLEFIYDQIPHRFALGAKTLYTGVGSGNLVLSDLLQTTLQNTGTDAVGDLDANGTADQPADRNIAVANRIKDFMTGASPTDLQLLRKKTTVKLNLMSFNTMDWSVEVSNEKRKGTRPIAGSFGFGNAIEIPEPIDYDTTQLKVGAEYAKNALYLNVSSSLSVFKNNNDTVTWDNPFRATDSTNASAYAQNYAGGPSKGLIDLYPDNKYGNVSLTGALLNLPAQSRLSLTASWGWMQQNDALVPYTTNTAIKTGAVSGTTGVTVPFDAFNKANLPQNNVDAKVSTTLYNLLLTSQPSERFHVKARYRLYKYDNKTGVIKFPGYVRADSVWEVEEEENMPVSFKKTTAGVDFGLDVARATTFSLGYTIDKMDRSATREVTSSNDKIYNLSLITKPVGWLDLKTSYEKSSRTGNYDYQAPHKEEIEAGLAAGTSPGMLPFLRKYDEANRDRNRYQFLATFYPTESFSLTGSVIVGKDNFKDSPFGLLEDKHSLYSLDADIAVTEKVNFYAFYSRENFKNKQKARQWNPCNPATDTVTTVGCTGANEGSDPYFVATGYDSPSNWTAENEDKVDTFSGGFKVAVKPDVTDFDVSYFYSKSDGQIKFESAVGANTNVDSNMFTPIDFMDVDDMVTQTLNLKLSHRLSKSLSLALGYTWENFDARDYNITGFTTTPTTANGTYQNSLFMDTLPKNYDVHIVSANLMVKF